MKLLEGSHRTLVDSMTDILTQPAGACLLRFGDFNGSQWAVYHDGVETLHVAISVLVKKNRLEKWGLMDHLKDFYGEECVLEEVPADIVEIMEFTPHVCVIYKDDGRWREHGELEKAKKEELENIAVKYGSLYKVVMTPIFEHHFARANDDELFDPVKVSYRENESLYISATKDNLSVYYSMWFETEDDLLYGKVFLKEFADAKKHHKSIAGAPSCDFHIKRPAALSSVKSVESDDDHRLWVVLSLFRKHTDTKPSVIDTTVDLLLQFRNYVHYHISCSHAYIHSRMRSRHQNLLKVLNRAKTNQTDHVAIKIE
eukprot:TRINITY_DN6770_c0_g2_i1.p1 TRINITY_DN6770_c0_g2~~TRINITY_DN6770_c0_g2_i1.p1  ORF type:complete len:329 (+),score=107.00 TRINITY_DN6770_c0_g2_i1:48-989(+)